ncbi:MAG: hypothetical protein BMS9Abin07_0273 [Acidimicrobiia bacterium]|nr:MAG: hypothetical protein BMS9Abin07_0273 [Acidimicrobiia bacterium]
MAQPLVVTLYCMALLEAFKQKVLELGRTEAKAKVKPLLVEDETIDRSAAGLDRRDREGFVLFWLLSEQALFLVAGGSQTDWAFRIPFEAVREVSIDFDESATVLPWYVRLSLRDAASGVVTTLEEEPDPANPLASPPPSPLHADELVRLARGELIPLSGFGSLPWKFRVSLTDRLEAAGAVITVSGAEAADAKRARRKK